jgi:hypothetical protein
MPIRGHDPIAWGFQPGPVFKDALARAADLKAQGQDIDTIRAEVLKLKPAAPAILNRRPSGSYALAMEATNAEGRPTSPPCGRTWTSGRERQ